MFKPSVVHIMFISLQLTCLYHFHACLDYISLYPVSFYSHLVCSQRHICDFYKNSVGVVLDNLVCMSTTDHDGCEIGLQKSLFSFSSCLRRKCIVVHFNASASKFNKCISFWIRLVSHLSPCLIHFLWK